MLICVEVRRQNCLDDIADVAVWPIGGFIFVVFFALIAQGLAPSFSSWNVVECTPKEWSFVHVSNTQLNYTWTFSTANSSVWSQSFLCDDDESCEFMERWETLLPMSCCVLENLFDARCSAFEPIVWSLTVLMFSSVVFLYFGCFYIFLHCVKNK